MTLLKSRFLNTPAPFATLLLASSVVLLSACGGGGNKPAPTIANSMSPELKTASIDTAMERALIDAEANGNSQEILAMMEQVHARNPDDPIVATRYARALREDDQINAAIRTLNPFMNGPKQHVEAITEMAMSQIAIGDFEKAESYASTSIELDPKNARGFLALGTAQDALGKHQEAEIAFRQGLKYWQGDSTPILNNLALNLASQGFLAESLALLEKAIKISPSRMDLERNRRIIATLIETNGPRAPAPVPKPGEPPVAEAVAATIAVTPPAKPKTSATTQEISAEDLNAKAAASKKDAPKAAAETEAKQDTPAQKPASSATAEEVNITSPETTLKNIKLKTNDNYN